MITVHKVVLHLTGRPRVCAECQRPHLAEDPSEYTQQRAALVGERGLCVCAAGPGHPATAGRLSSLRVTDAAE